MGLDVYLYKYKNFKKTREVEDKYEEESDKIYASFGGYDEMTDEDKDKARGLCLKLKEELNLDEFAPTNIELDSKKYPEHMFKVGYFRSSYNSSGTNRVLKDLIGMDLYTIFNPNDDYHIKPNWSSALISAKKAVDKLKLFKQKNGNIMAVETENPFMKLDPSAPKNNHEVLNLFLEEKKKKSAFDSYSNSKGSFFFGSPLKTLAFISGFDYLGNKTVYLVCEGDDDNLDWYIQALEIVVETCEYVLSQEDSDKYYLHWSG